MLKSYKYCVKHDKCSSGYNETGEADSVLLLQQ